MHRLRRPPRPVGVSLQYEQNEDGQVADEVTYHKPGVCKQVAGETRGHLADSVAVFHGIRVYQNPRGAALLCIHHLESTERGPVAHNYDLSPNRYAHLGKRIKVVGTAVVGVHKLGLRTPAWGVGKERFVTPAGIGRGIIRELWLTERGLVSSAIPRAHFHTTIDWRGQQNFDRIHDNSDACPLCFKRFRELSLHKLRDCQALCSSCDMVCRCDALQVLARRLVAWH